MEFSSDEEWEKYWQKCQDDAIIFASLTLFIASLLKSGYPKELQEKLRSRSKLLMKQYDENFRQAGGSTKDRNHEESIDFLILIRRTAMTIEIEVLLHSLAFKNEKDAELFCTHFQTDVVHGKFVYGGKEFVVPAIPVTHNFIADIKPSGRFDYPVQVDILVAKK